MARWGKFDFKEFEELAKRLNKAKKERVIERFIHDFLLEMAFRAETKIKRRTPVDTGLLRRSWRVGDVQQQGKAYVVEIINNTEYASFVEYGHRTGKDLRKWVKGRFMMTISMQQIERELPRYLEKRQAELLHQIIEGRSARRGGDE